MAWTLDGDTAGMIEGLTLPGDIGKATGSEAVDWIFVGAVVLIIATL